MAGSDEPRRGLRRLFGRRRAAAADSTPPAAAPSEPEALAATEPEVDDTPIPVELGITEEQEQAVHTFCRELLREPVAEEAALDTVAAFRALAGAPGAEGEEAPGDERLLAITRRMAAVSLPDRGTPADRRRAVALSLQGEPQCTCRESAVLIAGRANGYNGQVEEMLLSAHLADCPDCRSLDAHFERAERGFRAALPEVEQPAEPTADEPEPTAAAEPEPTADEPEPMTAAEQEPATAAAPEPAATEEPQAQADAPPAVTEESPTQAEELKERLTAASVAVIALVFAFAAAGVVAIYLATNHVGLS